MSMVRTRVVIAAAALLGACTSGPDYKKPAIDVPVTWKVEAPWRAVAPNDAAPKGPWWKGYNDAQPGATANEHTRHAKGSRVGEKCSSLSLNVGQKGTDRAQCFQ